MARRWSGDDRWWWRCLRWQWGMGSPSIGRAWCVNAVTVRRATDVVQAAHHRQGSAAWRKANPEVERQRCAAWRKANPERERQRLAAYYAANPETHRQICTAWRKANPELVRGYRAAWRKANPENGRRRNRARRARSHGAGGDGLPAELESAFFEVWGWRCAYCQRSDQPGVEVDHIHPLALGGSHGLHNLAPACRSCNSSKSATPLQRWRPDLAEFVPARAAWVAALLHTRGDGAEQVS